MMEIDAEGTNPATGKKNGIDIDYWLKIQYGKGIFEKLAGKNGEIDRNKEEFSVAPSVGAGLRLKLTARIGDNIIVRAMHVLTVDKEEQVTEMTEGRLEISGNLFFERRYFFGKRRIKPYVQDRLIFTGLVGEYEVKKKTRQLRFNNIFDISHQ